jgi:protein involved in polysaccharide export with SLBB domain
VKVSSSSEQRSAMNRFLSIIVAGLFLVASAAASAAQTTSLSAGGPQRTRTELNDLLHQLEAAASAPGISGAERLRAESEAALVRDRLTSGDIQVGDQIALVVEGEDALTETFTVRPGQILTLPGIGDISVEGVLRSELEDHLTNQLLKFIRDPVVHAESLVRVTISGEVGQPGFYGVRPERLLSDAIMAAGGPAANANLEKMYIERAGERIWTGEHLQRAIAEGRTLDQLSLQAGDQIVVPSRGQGMGTRMIGITTGLISAAALLVTIFQ